MENTNYSTDNFKDYLNVHEFFELVWDRIPEKLISDKYIDENIEFIRELTYEFHKDYLEDRFSVNLAAKIIERFFYITFKHKPLLCNVIDDWDVNNIEE